MSHRYRYRVFPVTAVLALYEVRPDVPADTATPPIEVEWHPDYRGGDWADMGELTIIAVPCRNPRLGVTDAAVNAAFEQQVGQPAACIIRWVEAETEVAP